jgi:hypothetical protein
MPQEHSPHTHTLSLTAHSDEIAKIGFISSSMSLIVCTHRTGVCGGEMKRYKPILQPSPSALSPPYFD